LGSRDHVSEPTPRDGPGTAEGITAPRRAIREIGGEERRDLGAGLPDLDRGAAGGGAGAEIWGNKSTSLEARRGGR